MSLHTETKLSRVALVRCEDYEPAAVLRAVERGLELLGGAARFAQAGERLVLKTNWLATAAPDQGATTHPSVLRAVALALQAAGAHVSYGDSPAIHSPLSVAKASGCLAVGEELGLPLADFVSPVEVHHPEGVQNRKFTVAKAVAECDGLVSLPKLKSHGFMRFTGAIKNQFGVIPGALKGEFHVRLPDARQFARMLVDLNNWVKPRLYVMDGIVAMEGNGPRSGTPRALKLLLLSSDPVAIDATACRIIDLDPVLVPTTVYGAETQAGHWEAERIELVGDPLESFRTPDFAIKRYAVSSFQSTGWLRALSRAIVPRPEIIAERCTACGSCVRACPVLPKAVDWHEDKAPKPPQFRYDRCIRCYCCQELCPEKAVSLRAPWLRRLLRLPDPSYKD